MKIPLRHKMPVLILVLTLMFGGLGRAGAQTANCKEGTRVIAHVFGESCVPENPEQVVALEWTYVEDLLALGVQPVGVADIQGYNNWVKIPVALGEDVVDVGRRQEPNLETIAELNPDLIIAVGFRAGQNYDDLSAIAPTLVFDPYPTDLSVSQFDEMLNTFNTIATAVNHETEADAVLEGLKAHFSQAAAALEAAGRGGESFILSQGWTTDSVATFRLFTDNALAAQILVQIGLENAWDVEPQQYGFTEAGIEGFVALADRDFNFFYVAPESDNDIFLESPLWSSLNFVKSEKAYWLGGDVWFFGGPYSAELLVDTVLAAMGVEIPVVAEATEATG